MRPTDIPDTGSCFPRFLSSGLLCDILWSDPEYDIQGWQESERGVSYVFSPEICVNFQKKHDLDLICRAH